MKGHTSDSGRSFVPGQPSVDQSRACGALYAGFRAGLAVAGQGVPSCLVHRVTEDAIGIAAIRGVTQGIPAMGRRPVRAAKNGRAFRPQVPSWPSRGWCRPSNARGMSPVWAGSLGGFIVENQLLVSSDGIEVMNRLPDWLIELR